MKTLPLIAHDPWLEPFTDAIVGRHNRVKEVKNKLTRRGKMQLSEFASGHLYYGLHRQHDGSWIFREWAPNATEIYLIGDFSDWQELPQYKLKSLHNGSWEIKLKPDLLHHLDLYKLSIHWHGGKVNAYRLGQGVLFKIPLPTSSRLKCGRPKSHTSLPNALSSLLHRLCSYMSAT